MTIEQLEKANEIRGRLKTIKCLRNKLKNKNYKKQILTFQDERTCFECMKDSTILDLDMYPELVETILESISVKINDLEKQFEEL